MHYTMEILTVAIAVLGATSPALAHDPQASDQGTKAPVPMMQGGGMMNHGGMSGMMGMMKMMDQMGPMMERCAEMMAATTERMEQSPNAPKTTEDEG